MFITIVNFELQEEVWEAGNKEENCCAHEITVVLGYAVLKVFRWLLSVSANAI